MCMTPFIDQVESAPLKVLYALLSHTQLLLAFVSIPLNVLLIIGIKRYVIWTKLFRAVMIQLSVYILLVSVGVIQLYFTFDIHIFKDPNIDFSISAMNCMLHVSFLSFSMYGSMFSFMVVGVERHLNLKARLGFFFQEQCSQMWIAFGFVGHIILSLCAMSTLLGFTALIQPNVTLCFCQLLTPAPFALRSVLVLFCFMAGGILSWMLYTSLKQSQNEFRNYIAHTRPLTVQRSKIVEDIKVAKMLVNAVLRNGCFYVAVISVSALELVLQVAAYSRDDEGIDLRVVCQSLAIFLMCLYNVLHPCIVLHECPRLRLFFACVPTAVGPTTVSGVVCGLSNIDL